MKKAKTIKMHSINLNYLKLLFEFIILLKTSILFGQDSSYFQQKVDYLIEVVLNDSSHILEGNIEIKYTNNSSDTLSFLYFHLWPNAYKHQQTAFAKQLLNQGRLDFHFSKKRDRGYIDKLFFTCNNTPIKWKEDYINPDIAKLHLPEPCKPKETIVIKTPFRVKIPADFSRLAHVGQAYMLCQWYPKPAVYDNDGWHQMPYLDQGEFYSEFGSFNVKITLPKNYVVAATGNLQTKSEMDFLDNKIRNCKKLKFDDLALEKDTFPSSSLKMKTIQYTAENVHDFAWFADKRYYVQKDKIKLNSGKEVACYVMFNNLEADLWKNAMKYSKRALKFYSEIVGEYPYQSVSVVQSDYRGCDMEYPMVTVIGSANSDAGLDNVITHEIGHNWFYGILGSNERDHPWLDEGWNSYMDSRYMSDYYKFSAGTEYLAYLYESKNYTDQAIESRSQDLSFINYYICGYAKPTMSFRYLQQYLGRAELDRILKKYYEKWKFKHPQPEDLRTIFEAESTKKLNWFFDNVINSTKHIDYAATKYSCCNKHNKARISIQNKGEIEAPFSLTALNDKGKIIDKVWVNPIQKGQDSVVEIKSAEVVTYRIDAEKEMPEINRNNNEIRKYGIFKKGEPLKFKFLADFKNPEKPRINIFPLIGFNLYDGLMIGPAIYNLPVPRRTWEYAIVPFFGTFPLAPVGMAELKHNSFIKKHRLTEGLNFKTYHKYRQPYSSDRPYTYKERFYKITPFIELELAKTSDISRERHLMRFENAFIIEENGVFGQVDSAFVYTGNDVTWRSTHRLIYNYKNKAVQTPMNILTMLEYANYNNGNKREHYIKLSLESNFKIMYSDIWAVDLRIFTGAFLFHTDREFGDYSLQLIAGNRKDFHYDDNIMARREQENALSQQISIREGGFKTAVENIQDFGSSNTFIFALNIKSDIPIKLPFRTKYLKIKPFLDIGYYKNTAPAVTITNPADEIFVSGGIMFDIWDGAAGIYLPLFGTNNIENYVKSFSGKDFYKRITFSFNLSRFRLEKVVNELFF